MDKKISIILPAKNESSGLFDLLTQLKFEYPDCELVLVNDGSTDDTGKIADELADKVIHHPYSMGNGAAIKSGARHATGNVLIFMDADGQHKPSDISTLLQKFQEGYEMVIGARISSSQATFIRRFGNFVYNKFASLMTGVKIRDLTSGFRVVDANKFRQFLYLLPNGFSYPTTITMSFLRSGYPISYVSIEAQKRVGASKINLFRDGARFFLIILKIGSLFSPMRLFFPISIVLFSTGIAYYIYTYINFQRFTNMSAVLFLSSLLIFLIGIVSEQISALHYLSQEKPSDVNDDEKR